MEIRGATPEDLPKIISVFRQCWNESYKDLLPSSVRESMTEEAAHELWKSAVVPSVDRKTFVLDVDGQILGVARVGVDGEKTHLFSLYIAPSAAGKGFGKALLEKVLEGSSTQTLWVFKENEVAQNLYKKFGFNFTGVERIDPRWQIPEVEMSSTTQR